MKVSRRPLLAGNWKMNGLCKDGIVLARAVAEGAMGFNGDMVICPPFPLLYPVRTAIRGGPLQLGAQDCHPKPAGAFTGDVSASLLKDIGCTYVIVGHSERREGHGESNDLIRAKVMAAHEIGLTVIICIGETESQREAGKTEAILTEQLFRSVPDSATVDNTVIAYEPIWAIGTGRTPSPTQAQAVHAHIRTCLAGRYGQETADAIRLLYGGSMKSDNASALLAQPDIDGGLIGGASLKAEDFLDIAHAFPAR